MQLEYCMLSLWPLITNWLLEHLKTGCFSIFLLLLQKLVKFPTTLLSYEIWWEKACYRSELCRFCCILACSVDFFVMEIYLLSESLEFHSCHSYLHFIVAFILHLKGTSVLSPLIPMGILIVLGVTLWKKSIGHTFDNHPVLYVMSFGMASSKITNKLVVCGHFVFFYLFIRFTRLNRDD